MNRFDSAPFLLRLILICLAGLTALVLATGYVLTRQKAATNRLSKAIDLHDRSCRLADQIRQSSDDLTRMVRTYAVTGDSTFEEHFYTILNIRDGKVPRPEHYDFIFWDFKVAGEAMPGSPDGKKISLRRLMEDAEFADEEFELLAEAKRRSDRLVELEEVAMNAMKGKFRDEEGTFTKIKAPDRELALQILFGEEYHQAKSDIMKPIDEFLLASDKRTTNALADAQEERRSLSLALVCLLCCLLTVSPLVALAGYGYHRVTYADLRDSEGRFRATFEQAAVGIAHVSPEGGFLRINDRFCEIVGYTKDEMLSLTFPDITHPDDLAADVGHVQRLLRGEANTYSMEKRYCRKDGDTVWVNLTVSLIREDTGKPRWFVSVAEDITELKRAELQLRESEERFRSLMEQSPLAIEILTPEGQISEVNAAWLRLWDFNEEEARQSLEKYNMLTDQQTVDLRVAPLIRKAFAGEPVVLPPIEYVVNRTLEDIGLEHIRGRSPWIQCHLYAVKNPSGEITNVVNTYVDITEQKQAERDLNAYQERLRALASELTMTEERERRRIATELHDGAAQSLAFARMQLASACKAVAEAGAAKKLDSVSQILRQSLEQIREVLLDLSSPSMNEIGLGVAISEWLAQQIGRQHGLKTSFADECGKVPLDDDVRAVLFRNTRELLANVVKHAEADSVSVRINSTGEALRITIEDDGAGLDPNNVAHTVADGGFGLFSIREFMLDLGGSLEIVSAPGKGCKATLVMPLDIGEERSR